MNPTACVWICRVQQVLVGTDEISMVMDWKSKVVCFFFYSVSLLQVISGLSYELLADDIIQPQTF